MPIFQFDDCAFEFAKDLRPVPFKRAKGDQSSLQDWLHKTAMPVLSGFAADKSSEGIYLIHAHGVFSADGTRQSLEGVEVLKHIRLTESLGEARWWHAILYSFEPRESILLRKNQDLIIYSPGVTFLRLPEALDLNTALAGINSPIVAELAHPGAHRISTPDHSLRPYIACDYYEDDAHQISNWWGARQVIHGLNLVRSRQTDDEKIAAGREFRRLKNKKAAFLYGGFGIQPVEDAGTPKIKEDIKDYWLQLEMRLQEANSTKVVYIDDEMDKGWKEAIHLAFTGDPLPATDPGWLVTIDPRGKECSDSGMKALAETIIQNDPHLIITDLRLWGPSEPSRDVKKISGGMLIKHLKVLAPAVPILLLTASNKSWTVEHALDLGVDAYWMKEGIGDHSTPEASLSHSAELIRLLSRLLGREYQLIRNAHEKIVGFTASQSKSWWKNMQWGRVTNEGIALPTTTMVRGTFLDRLALYLTDIISAYRTFLRAVNIRPAGATSFDQRSLSLQIIAIRVGLVIECIHRFDELEKLPGKVANAGTIGGYIGKNTKVVTAVRKDWFGQALYDARNSVAHFRGPGSQRIEEKHLNSLIAALIAWLSTKPLQIGFSGKTRPSEHCFFTAGHVLYDPALVKEYKDISGEIRLNFPPEK